MPATSPTLSPTLSAMVAGLRGSSSGMPASSLPTRSAPTSAALVKMPPPTRMNRAMVEAPREKPDSRGSIRVESDGRSAPAAAMEAKMTIDTPSREKPTTLMPMTLPPMKATRSAPGSPVWAAAVVRTLAAVATRMPTKPASAEQPAPRAKASPWKLKGPQFSAASTAATTTTKGARARYSRPRKVRAPWAM